MLLLLAPVLSTSLFGSTRSDDGAAFSSGCLSEGTQCVPASATATGHGVRCDATRLLNGHARDIQSALDWPLPHPADFVLNKSAIATLVFAMREKPRPLQHLLNAGKKPTGRFFYLNLGCRGVGDSTTEHMTRGKFGLPASAWTQHAFDADVRMAKGWKEQRPDVHFHHAAIWVRDETLHFGYRKSASHIVEDGAGWKPDSKVKETVQVPAIDFAGWLMRNVKLEDYVVVKMDIESAEYAVLPRMLATGAACLVDELYLECHFDNKNPQDTKREQCVALLAALRGVGVAAFYGHM